MNNTTKHAKHSERERVEAKSERTKNFFKKAGFLILCLILLVFTVVEASPPGSAYVPGETLAPSCSPGDTNCKVALTSGSVLFSNGTDLITQDNSNFYWDDTNNRLGIGTTTPSYKLTILGDLFVNTSSTLGNVISGTWQGTAIGDSYISSASTWNAKITTSSLSAAYGPLSYNNATGVFSLPTSTASQSGFLSSADWTTFNNKQNNISFPISVASTSLTASLPLLLTTNDLSLTGRLLTIHNIATSTGSLIAGKADTTGWYGLTIGTDGKVLMASSTATYGLSWETVALTPGGSNTQIQFNNSGSFLGDANFTWASSTQLLIITGTSTISGNLGVGTTTPVSLFTVATTTNIFNVLSSGYVGIGTSTPGYKLTINSSNATDNLFQVATTTNQGIFVINSNGNVGIGTTTPNQKLSVVGNIQIASSTGGLIFGDATTQTTAATGLKSVQVFTASSTWTKPAGVTKVRVQIVGGGGGGGGDPSYSSGAGAAGGYAEEIIDVTSISSVAVTVGAGGAGGTSSGSSGGTSSFGAYLSATGGGGGAGSGGGAGGAGSGGDINIDGGDGGSGWAGGDRVAGVGGSSYFGGGGRGSSASGVGQPGKAYGSGGGGGIDTGQAGGTGKAGIVIVYEYY